MKQYEAYDIGTVLSGNSYPGRGIIMGKTRAGGRAVCAYFIMGRSENSRNRYFEFKDGALYTRPFDESKLEDPSLIIYAAVKSHDNMLVATNGDQTDTIIEYLEKDDTFENALFTRKFEPDHPNLTPRISGMISFAENGSDFAYRMSILKSMDEDGNRCGRYFYYFEPVPGLGHFIHTYERDGNPLPTFSSEPQRIEIPDDIDEFTDAVWENLDDQNRISLYVRYTDPSTGEYDQRIINKNV